MKSPRLTGIKDPHSDIEHIKVEESIEDSSGVPQVWQRRSEGSGTSHNAFSGDFWGDGTIRVRALGAAGYSDWSDPVSHMCI